MVKFQGEDQAYEEVVETLDLEIGFYSGLMFFCLKFMVFFIGKRRIEVQKAE